MQHVNDIFEGKKNTFRNIFFMAFNYHRTEFSDILVSSEQKHARMFLIFNIAI